MTFRAAVTVAAISCAGCAASLRATDLTITHVTDLATPATSTDQNGAPFDLSGLSGIAFLPNGNAIAVMDNSNKVLHVDATYDTEGTLTNASVVGGLSLAASADYEELVAGCAGATLFLAQENDPGVREIDPISGTTLADLPVPAVFSQRRPNRGFESLAIAPGATRMWTATEEALTVDGPGASPSSSSLVRLLRYERTDTGWTPTAQFPYVVEAMHGPAILGNGQSGLVDLIALPNDRLLAVERSLALAPQLFLTRVYEIDTTGASEVTSVPALDGADVTPVSKSLVYQGSHQNLEGLAIGPADALGQHPLLGVVDDGDPLSSSALILFRLTGLRACEADGAPGIGIADLLAYLAAWFNGDSSAERSGDCPASVTITDLLDFLGCWFDA